jgi:hypothetical protein
MDARKQQAMVPCMHVCACEACAQRLLDVTRSCRFPRSSEYTQGPEAAMTYSVLRRLLTLRL